MHKLLIICGPTATGKTNLAIKLAKKFNGEIVSADSRQVYRSMDIGTGKDLPKKIKIQKSKIKIIFAGKGYVPFAHIIHDIPVWLYDVVTPKEEFSVAHYTALARPLLADIWERGKLPIVVGGTGLYIRALVKDIGTSGVEPDPGLRIVLDKLPVRMLQRLVSMLLPSEWSRLNESDRANPRRLIRKIEIAMAGKEYSMDGKNPLNADVCTIGLTAPLPYLDKKIDDRVRERVKQGIVKEIEGLLARGIAFSDPGMTSLGYREWQPWLTEGFVRTVGSEREIIGVWKRHERQYARRQLTWFKKQPGIDRFDITGVRYEAEIERRVSAWYTGGGYGIKN